MKSSPVVRIVGRVAVGVWLAACSTNGPLFEEASEPSSAERSGADLSGADPAGSDEPPADPASLLGSPSSNALDGEPGDEQPNPEGLPFAGGSPLPPVAGMPQPQETKEAAEQPMPEGPVVLSVSPPEGAVGVDNAQNIAIVFSVPMDREATEAAYQSESIPSSAVSFEWNDAGTELTIVPDAPLAYPVGDDPAQLPARRVSFFISSSAADLEGRSLSVPFESSFSLLRRVEFTLPALQNRDLSGSFRSNDTYGAGQCARGQINMCVGDSRVNNANEQYKGFISFQVSELPEAAQSVSAELTLEITGLSGNPFGGLGGLVLEHASFEVIDAEAFSSQALDELGLIANAGGTGTIISADVAAALLADQGERSISQYRLRFEDETDGDNTSDVILSAWDTQTLDVSYLLP